jgi:putative phosphoribosyl transferase
MQAGRFRDRVDAGRRLAARLAPYARDSGLTVLGLARGGVPVAFEVAAALEAPLDALAVRKVGAPGQPELAIGAVAPGGIRVLNHDLIGQLGMSPAAVEAAVARARPALELGERAWRGDRPPLDLRGGTVILVDDGLATGATMRAAVAWAKHQQARHVVVAAPVAAPGAAQQLRGEADDVVAVFTPPDFDAVGAWYDDFTQTSDDQVVELLERGRRAVRPRHAGRDGPGG